MKYINRRKCFHTEASTAETGRSPGPLKCATRELCGKTCCLISSVLCEKIIHLTFRRSKKCTILLYILLTVQEKGGKPRIYYSTPGRYHVPLKRCVSVGRKSQEKLYQLTSELVNNGAVTSPAVTTSGTLSPDTNSTTYIARKVHMDLYMKIANTNTREYTQHCTYTFATSVLSPYSCTCIAYNFLNHSKINDI